MSAIRPPVPSPLFPAQTPPSPARASRSDFFRTALDGLRGPAETEAGGTVDTPVRALPAQAAIGAPDPLTRPGALLDIRV